MKQVRKGAMKERKKKRKKEERRTGLFHELVGYSQSTMGPQNGYRGDVPVGIVRFCVLIPRCSKVAIKR